MSILFDALTLTLKDERVPNDKILNGGNMSVCYTLLSDDITVGQKPSCTPYSDRRDEIISTQGRLFAADTKTTVHVIPYRDGVCMELESARDDLSEYGIELPFNFMGKKNGGGWENQFLFNSPYTSKDKSIIYAYLTKPNGANLLVAVMGGADGWKMDYSPFSWGHFFMSLRLLANFDRVYGTAPRQKRLKVVILPVGDFDDCLSRLSEAYGVPLLDYDVSGGKIGDTIALTAYGEPTHIMEIHENKSTLCEYSPSYRLRHVGETELIPIRDGKAGAGVSVYAYTDIIELYKMSMDTVDLDTINAHTNGNLCEHQCWMSATLRLLRHHKDKLSAEQVRDYEKRLRYQLSIITEEDEERAIKSQTILKAPLDRFGAYNVYKSCRVQELFFAINILLDSYLYFGDEKYYEYAVGATNCLLDNYQCDDGHLEVDWGDKKDDYTTVCCPMIPLANMADFLKDKDASLYQKCREACDKMARFLYLRGMSFPTEGSISEQTEAEMEDGSISCTALALLYYSRFVCRNDDYIKKAKEILDAHEAWVMKTPICQMHGSSLRWWETGWEGDADGPALCCGHAWTIWRAEADYHYYVLTGDTLYLKKAQNGFLTNLSKIDSQGNSYAIYSADRITGGGFHTQCSRINYRLVPRFPDTRDCGLSRYVWIRMWDTFLTK